MIRLGDRADRAVEKSRRYFRQGQCTFGLVIPLRQIGIKLNAIEHAHYQFRILRQIFRDIDDVEDQVPHRVVGLTARHGPPAFDLTPPFGQSKGVSIGRARGNKAGRHRCRAMGPFFACFVKAAG